MNTDLFFKSVSILLLMLVLLTVSCIPAATDSNVSVGDIDVLKSTLEKDGFIVQEGKLELFDIIKMYDYGYIPVCWGNNPSTPYTVFKLPMAPGQTVPNMISDVVIYPENRGLYTGFKLRPDEAVLFIGKTPPELDYFSYRSYLAVRYFPAEGQTRRIFASLGDTINNMDINTSGTPDGSPGNPFSQDTVIISTADKRIDARVRSALQAAGYSPSIMNTDIIPSGLLNMGLDEHADFLAFIHRVAFFKDKEAGEEYMSKAQGTVLRLTPKHPAALDPFPVQPLKVRGTGDTSELNLLSALDDLRNAILAKHGAANATELNTGIWLMEGFDAIQRGVDVIGENRDTFYLRSDEFTLGDNPDQYLIVYGVNHAATGKATYSNFGMYGAKAINGVGAVSNHDFIGTAEEYIPGHPVAKYLYVWKVARRALGDTQCMEIEWDIGAAGIDLDQLCFVGFRAYLEKSTQVGPNWSEVLYDRVIKFSPPE